MLGIADPLFLDRQPDRLVLVRGVYVADNAAGLEWMRVIRNYERSRGIWTNLFGGSKKNSEENSEK
jgi:hypothetical protein